MNAVLIDISQNKRITVGIDDLDIDLDLIEIVDIVEKSSIFQSVKEFGNEF